MLQIRGGRSKSAPFGGRKGCLCKECQKWVDCPVEGTRSTPEGTVGILHCLGLFEQLHQMQRPVMVPRMTRQGKIDILEDASILCLPHSSASVCLGWCEDLCEFINVVEMSLKPPCPLYVRYCAHPLHFAIDLKWQL